MILACWLLGRQIGFALNALFGDQGGPIALAVILAVGAVLAIVRCRLRLEHPWLWWPLHS